MLVSVGVEGGGKKQNKTKTYCHLTPFSVFGATKEQGMKAGFVFTACFGSTITPARTEHKVSALFHFDVFAIVCLFDSVVGGT